MNGDPPHCYVFEGFRLDLARRRLSGAGGEALPLPARAFDVLAYLVENRARIVTKDEVMRAVWSRVVVEENNLNQAVYNIRRALGDSRESPRFIVTVAGRGYQFIASTSVDRGESQPAPATPSPEPGNDSTDEPATGAIEVPAAIEAAVPEPAPAAATQPPPPAATHSRRWLLLAGGATVAAAAGFAWLRNGRRADTGLPASVAVLPFRPLVESGADTAIELGITETMINRLSELPGVVVSPLSSVRRFADPGADPLAAGRELRVAAVVEGNVQLDQERLRLTARLLDVESGRALWSGRFNEALGDFFSVQESLADQVVRALSLELSDAQQLRLARRDTTDPEAWQLYLNGRFHWNRKTEDGLLRAIEFYEAAIARDPKFALPFAGLADALAVLGVFDLRPPADVFPRSRDAALRAIELDDQLAEAHAALGHYSIQYERDWQKGERLYRRALELRPNYAQAVMWLANNHLVQGRLPLALSEARRAQLLEPLSPTFAANVGLVLSYSGRLDAAYQQLSDLFDASPEFPLARHHLARVHIFRNEPDAAIRLLEGYAPRSPGGLPNLGRAYALAGRTDDARAEIAKLQALGAAGIGVGYYVAQILATLGEYEPALDALESGMSDHSQQMGWLRLEPAFAIMRDEPRFKALVERLGLV
jgi:DNA-binding winged helix-turn-helix (wHTH) protein/TolB-like protein/Flp pilus assembly protein TadD